MHDQTRWLDEALTQIPAKLTADDDGTTHRQIVDSYLRPLLKRCRAKSRGRFWQWLRLQLAKTEDMSLYLTWMLESRCPLEITKAKESFRHVINGDVALIEVVDGSDHVVWRVPMSHLKWALSLYPVSLKRLRELEPPEVAQIRQLKRQLRTRLPFLTPKQRQELEKDIAGLEAIELRGRAYHPSPRYMLVKYARGGEVAVHRLFLDAGPHDEVEAVDGDFTNFTTATYTRTVAPVATDGLVVAKGNRPPSVWSDEVVVQNLRITNSEAEQKDFDSSMLQVKTTLQGDIDTHLPTQPNADLGDGPTEPDF